MNALLIVIASFVIVGVATYVAAERICRKLWPVDPNRTFLDQITNGSHMITSPDQDIAEAIEVQTERLWIDGMSLEDAKTRARQEFGNPHSTTR